MILNSFCIIVLSVAILMNSFTQSCHTKSIRALNDKLADLRLRFNSSRGKEEEIHAEKIRKGNKDWCQEDSKIFEQNYLVCSPHASKLCSYLTDTEKGILMSVIRCCVDNSSGNDGYYFNNCCISNESYFTGFSYCYVPYSDMQNALKDLQNKYFWYAKNGEPWFFRILDGATVPSAIRGTFKGKWNLFINLINRFKSNSYICDTMHPVFTPEAQAILMKPLLEAYRSELVKHIDDFDLLRLGPSHQNEDKTKEE